MLKNRQIFVKGYSHDNHQQVTKKSLTYAITLLLVFSSVSLTAQTANHLPAQPDTLAPAQRPAVLPQVSPLSPTQRPAVLPQESSTPSDRHPAFNLSTNLLYDLVFMPSIGFEVTLGSRFSLAATATYGWCEPALLYDNVRVVTADLEFRLWTSRRLSAAMQRGFHVGIYAAIYRYDFLSCGVGQQAKANWGTGITLGYSIPLSRHFSIDLNAGFGYVGGRYKRYEVSDDRYEHNVWTADKVRHYWGPTRAEASLVWHIGSVRQKGGKP